MTYEEVTHRVGRATRAYISAGMYGFRNLLGAVSERSQSQDGVMITALVESKRSKKPANGFYVLARQIGRTDAKSESDEDEFRAAELERIWQRYASAA